MGVRNFRYASSDNAVTGETAKGDGDVLIYQTSQATPPESIFQGTSIGSIKGPQETSMVIVAYAHRDVNATGANGTTYDVEFYGATEASGEGPQLAAINGAIAQFGVDGGDTGIFSGYPYSSDVDAAGADVNSVNEGPILVIKDNAILS
tara:strand:+ start:238 stop:684 length:447 start_codon:yes stop_codon:yes gene_type:complete